MRALVVTTPLPTHTDANTMAPLACQLQSLRQLGLKIRVLEIKGYPKVKYLQSLPVMHALASVADLIHAHYGFCGWLARAQLGKPIVVSFMGDDLLGTPDAKGNIQSLSKFWVRTNRWLSRLVDATIVKSDEMARIIAPVQAHVVPNGVALQTFRPLDKRESRIALGWSVEKTYILFPGDPTTPRKGFPLAQAAILNASKRLQRSVELIVLRNVVAADVPLYMNACDAMLMTSWVEGSPNVVKEAMACELPIVSVPVGDVVELFDGLDGFVVCPRVPEALADAIVQYLQQPPVTTGRFRLKQRNLDLESVARRIADIYDIVLSQNRQQSIYSKAYQCVE